MKIVKYEDLVSKKRLQLIDLYNFFDVSFDGELLNLVETESDFALMRNKSANPAFYDSGLAQDMSVLSDATYASVSQVCAETFSKLGYQ